MLTAPFTMFAGLNFFLNFANIFMRVVVVTLADRATESD